MEKSSRLLQEAAQEIKSLRRRNELMSARLDMFDSLNAILHTQVSFKSEGMSPDLVWEIERFVESQKNDSQGSVNNNKG